MPDLIIIFCSKLPLNFSVLPLQMLTLKFLQALHTLFDTYFDHIYWRNLNQIVWFQMYKIMNLWAKSRVFKTIFDEKLTPFCLENY